MCGDLERQIRQVLARLELISHVSAAPVGSSRRETTEDIGGKRPPGGLMRGDDYARDEQGFREPYPQRSFAYFAKRFEHAKSEAARRDLLEKAEEALDRARRQPPYDPATAEGPPMDSPQWKRWVAETDLAPKEIVRIYGVSRQYVSQLRKRYRDDPRERDAA